MAYITQRGTHMTLVANMLEFIIPYVVLAILIAFVVLAFVAVYYFLDGMRGYEERITALEQRIETLEEEDSDR